MNRPCAVGERRKSRKCPLGHCHESNGLTDNMNKGTTSYCRADDCHGNARKKGLFQMAFAFRVRWVMERFRSVGMSPCGGKQKTPAGCRHDFLSGFSSALAVRWSALAVQQQMLATGGRLDTVSARLCGQADGL
jgi:hypothetical protein